MRIGVTLPVEDGLSSPDLVSLAQTAESLGYEALLCGEVAGPEVMATLGMVAARTDRIRLGSGIVATSTRSPVLTAMGFASLSSMAPGRVVAGFGASSPIVVRDWHGREFGEPVATAREFVTAFRAVIRGEKVLRSGGRFPIDGFCLSGSAPQEVRVWLAAMNDRMLRLAGEIADGVFLTWCPPSEVGAKLELVREGAESVGRSLVDLEVVVSYWGFAGGPGDVERVRERCRRSVLAYAMVPTHQRAFVNSFPELEEARQAWEAGDRRRALKLTSNDAVDAMCAVGSGADVAERARELAAAGVDLPIVLPIGPDTGDPRGALGTLRTTAVELSLAAPD